MQRYNKGNRSYFYINEASSTMQTAQSTKLNDMQQFMLKQFERPLTAEQQIEIKQLISDYFARLVDQQIDEIWERQNMTQADLDKALHTHYRTPYRR